MKKIILTFALAIQALLVTPGAQATDGSSIAIVLEPLVQVEASPATTERVALHLSNSLSSIDNVVMLERDSLSTLVDERTLGNSLMAGIDQTERGIGIRGAQYLLGGSVLEHNGDVHLFGKLIRVADGSMRAFKARSRHDLIDGLANIAASEVQSLINTWLPITESDSDQKVSRMLALASRLDAFDKPTLSISIEEQHSRRRVADRARNRAGSQVIDPAAETEFLVFSSESGFPIVDKDPRFEKYVDVLILGEGFTEVSYRNGSALGVTARLEVKAISRLTGRLLAVDRQTSVAVAGSELIGSKDALAKAAASVAERMLPKLVLASQSK